MKSKDWYPINFSGFWQILDSPYYEGKDVLNSEDVGDLEAEKNAILASSAPLLLNSLVELVEYYVMQKELSDGELEEMHSRAINAYKKAIGE